MSFPRYEAYRDSGVEWLGPLPAHWKLPPLYMRYEAMLGKMLDEKRISGEYLLPYLRNTDVQWDRVNVDELPTMDVAPDEYERFTVRPGDLLVCEGGEVGRAAIWQGALRECAFQKAIHRLRPIADGEVVRFLYYCLAFAAAREVFIAGSNPNTIPHLTGEKLRRYRFPCPPEHEQQLIADFLDRETDKLDTLITEQQRLIELLAEKRQSVISHIVTNGLTPDIPMKDSGVEWLGAVPRHWKPRRLKALFRAEKRQNQIDKEVLSVFRDYGVVLKASRDDNYNKTPEDLSLYQLVLPGDLVVNKMKAWQGSLGISSYEGITSPDYIVFTPRHDESAVFLHYLLRSQRVASVYRSISNGIRPSQWRLDPSGFLDLTIYLPPRDEQEMLGWSAEEQSLRIGGLISQAECTIALLQERRAALISAAVTGKIDVRGLVDAEAVAA